MKNKSRAIAFDFDGVIHSYENGYSGGMSEPNEGAFKSLIKLHEQGFRIVIHSCRPKKQIVEWFGRYWYIGSPYGSGRSLAWKEWEITNVKPIDAIAFVDDRAIRFTNFKDIEKYFI